jgi:hypothetical protein
MRSANLPPELREALEAVMFIFGGRTLGTLAALVCAGVIAYGLGGCASGPVAAELVAHIESSPDVRCASGTTRSCVAYGPRREDASCGCDDDRAMEAALARLVRQ